MSTKHLLKAAMVAASLLTIPSFAAAQDTSTGTLTVTATVESSIGLTFENDAAGVALAGAGTNAPRWRSARFPRTTRSPRRG